MAGPRAACALILTVAFGALGVTGASGAPGQLDRSFGTNGIGGGGELGPHYAGTAFDAVAEEPDGSLLATRNGKVYHYLADGTLDPGFAPREPEPAAVEVTLAEGKVLVADNPGSGGAIRRLLPDGASDVGFHGGTSERTASYWVEIIVPLESGQILVAGAADRLVGKSGVEGRTGLSRLNENGTLDRSFGEAGSAYLSKEDIGDLIGLVPQPDGGLLVVGSTTVVRLTAAGGLDPSYRTDGANKNLIGFRALPGGGVALAGTVEGTGEPGQRDFFVAHYRPSGELDPAFSSGKGIATADFGGTDVARAVLWGENGSALLGGATLRQRGACIAPGDCARAPALARFGADGNLDPGFGNGGLLVIDELASEDSGLGDEGVEAMAARSAGGVVAAGSAGPAGSVAFLAAITPTGGLDPGFGSAGVVRELSPSASSETSGAVAVAADSKILVAGATNAGPGSTAALFRFTASGNLDSRFGSESGFAALPGVGRALAVAVGRSGAAVVLAEGSEVVRVTAAGRVDSHFGTGGLVALKRPRDHFDALAVLPGGKILLAGVSNWHGSRSRMLVARLLPTGRPDPSFGEEGFATIGCRRRGRCAAAHIAVQIDGRILLAGRIQKTGATARFADRPSRLAVARMLPNGAPDHDFGAVGLITLRADYRSAATALATSGDRILVAGWAKARGSSAHALLMRFTSDGRPDRRFGDQGIRRWPREGNPSAVIPTLGRIVVVSGKGARPTHPFHRDGRPDAGFARPRLGKPRKVGSHFEAVLQGGKAVIAWTEVNGPSPSSPSVIRLARLRNR